MTCQCDWKAESDDAFSFFDDLLTQLDLEPVTDVERRSVLARAQGSERADPMVHDLLPGFAEVAEARERSLVLIDDDSDSYRWTLLPSREAALWNGQTLGDGLVRLEVVPSSD